MVTHFIQYFCLALLCIAIDLDNSKINGLTISQCKMKIVHRDGPPFPENSHLLPGISITQKRRDSFVPFMVESRYSGASLSILVKNAAPHGLVCQ